MKSKEQDHRSRITLMLIRKALMELLRQKPIQAISIKELCESAGINRGTFYAHYTDMYDLLQKIESDMLPNFSPMPRQRKLNSSMPSSALGALAFCRNGWRRVWSPARRRSPPWQKISCSTAWAFWSPRSREATVFVAFALA